MNTALNDNDYRQWAKKLERCRQESALLKYRLSERIDNDDENIYLQKAEYFQNELLVQDEVLKKLLLDLKKFKSLLSSGVPWNDQKAKLHNTLQNEVSGFETRFLALTQEFNKEILQNQ